MNLCLKCNILKPLSEMKPSTIGKVSGNGYCRACMAKIDKDYRLNNLERKRQHVRVHIYTKQSGRVNNSAIVYHDCSCGRVSVFRNGYNMYCRPCKSEQSYSVLDEKLYRQEQRTKAYVCMHCDKTFTKTLQKIGKPTIIKYCSQRCASLANRKPTNNNIRARKHNVLRQDINPIKVFNAYNWTCAICKVKTPKELKGSNHSNAPTIDHIIPISKGGAHVYGNLQLLCRKCNCIDKVDSITNAQLPLFFQKVNQRTKDVEIQSFDPGRSK